MSGAKGGALVSVIIPVWNAGENLEKLIKQLCGQSYANLEIVAIDDGSTDDSLRVLRGLAKNDARLKVIHQENGGVGAARNRGIEAATGKYLVFVDADDEVETDFIKVMVEAMEENPRAILAMTGKRYDKILDGKTVDTYVGKRRARRTGERLSDYVAYLMLFDGRIYSMTSRAFRAEIVREENLRLEIGRNFAEDTKFTMDYLAATERRFPDGARGSRGEIVFIPEPLYIYHFGTETSAVRVSSTIWENWERSYCELEDWARSENGGKLGLRTRILLGLLRLRWRISWMKANRRMKKVNV